MATPQTPTERAREIRHEILLQLYGSGPDVPLCIEHIRKVAHRQDFNYDESELRREVMFLIDQGLVARVDNRGTGKQRYRITSAGMLHYENS